MKPLDIDWFERHVGLTLYRYVEVVANNAKNIRQWTIRWEDDRYWEEECFFLTDEVKKSLPVHVEVDPENYSKKASALRDMVWKRVSEKLKEGWAYSLEETAKLKRYFSVEDGQGVNDDVVHVIEHSEQGTKEVYASFNLYCDGAREEAAKLAAALNAKVSMENGSSLTV